MDWHHCNTAAMQHLQSKTVLRNSHADKQCLKLSAWCCAHCIHAIQRQFVKAHTATCNPVAAQELTSAFRWPDWRQGTQDDVLIHVETWAQPQS